MTCPDVPATAGARCVPNGPGGPGGFHVLDVRDEDGSVLAVGWTAIAVAALVLVLVVDLTAYLAAFRRAQAAADAAALAAVVRSDPRGDTPGSPAAAARRVAAAQGAEVRACRCAPGERVVTVTAAVPVRTVAVTRFAGRTATATASAHLARDAPDADT